ncbi:MAG: nucleoside deaminase [Armatimonadetes bacterium]|nr:nucleoside deaminase [Armatimonadota bacterium]
MEEAFLEARLAFAAGEVPVGAVMVHQGKIIGRGHNLRESTQDPLAHAEIIAIREASRYLHTWRFAEVTAYVTLEPCLMCAGAFVQARISRLVYGAEDPKAGAIRSLYQVAGDPRLNHQISVTSGVLEEPCSEILKEFFRSRRRDG